jgi:hypothetical protein
MMAEIQKTHIEGNVPEEKDFNRLLERDLKKFFSASGKDVEVKYEFLRNGPTQSGVAYPKYYLWVNVSSGDKDLKQGAIRVAAIEKRYFEVTNFLSKSSINKQPSIATGVFPKLLLPRIYKLAGVN